MSGARNDGPGVRATGEDPFAELIDLIEDREPGPRSISERQASGAFDDFPYEDEATGGPDRPNEDAFDLDRALAEELSAGPVDVRHTPSAGPAQRQFYDNDEQSDVGLALAGLSEPATPRISGPAETGAVAPERRFDEPETAETAPATLDDFDELIASELAVMQQPAASYAYDPSYDPAAELEYDDDVDGYDRDEAGYEAAVAPPAARRRSVPAGGNRRRALFFAGGVAAVALVGVFGIYAGGGVLASATGGGEPLLIRADTEPFKIAPADPGGAVVPNQNKAVYQRVARGGPTSAPEQEMLITAAEEPLDISFEDEISDLPGVMVGAPDLPEAGTVEVAQAQAAPNETSSTLQPHRVRTFDVRPDGTLVPRAETPVATAPSTPPAGTAQTPLDPATATGQPAVPLDTALPAAAPIPADPAAAAVQTPPPAATPQEAPPETVAAIEPAAPLPADAHFVQISSQPSEALARDSMASLSQRYSSAIGGRNLTIQPAEIDGRGTFYRVRIITASRDEANSVCQTLQSAGGSCFVTR